MKNKLFALIVLISLGCNTFAQKKIKGNGIIGTEIRETLSYDVISLYGSLDVELIDGDEGNITIKSETNFFPYIETKVVDNNLIIQFKEGISYQTRKGIKIYVPVKDLSKIELTGSGDITSKHIFNDQNLDVIVKGSGDISLEVDNENINSEIFGSGDISIKGKTQNLNASVKGSGDINAKPLKAKKSKLSVKGSGDIESTTLNQVDAEIRGSGDITIYGNPSQIKKDGSGSGDIYVK